MAEDNYTVDINPANMQQVGKVKNTDMSQMPQMFKKAREAQKIWAAKSYNERKKHLTKMRDYIVAHTEELAEIVSRSNGKTRTDALVTEVMMCSLAAEWYGNHAQDHLKPKPIPASSFLFLNKRNTLIRVPLGVVGIISPWNYPLSIPFGEVVMGLMAGNAIMLKVAAATITVGDAIDRIVKAGELPDGLFQHIVGSGAAVSKAFFTNGINKIFFTGSVDTGKQLMADAAPTLTPLSLELGGKDPMIVLEDADLERAANGACWAGYQNAGQSCGGVERVYVHESVYDDFLELMKEKTAALRHGYDEDFEVDMGSMTTKAQLEHVERQVNDAVKKGAKIEAQSQPVGKQNGYFYPATLMTGVDHSMELMQIETFGPVVPVMKFKTIEEAIELANDSIYGLTSSVFTTDTNMAKSIAERIEAGVTTINDHLYTHGQAETPWGGWKASGIGRTHSALGLEEMTNAKLINHDMAPAVKRNIWWYPFNKKTYESILELNRLTFPRNVTDLVAGGINTVSFLMNKMFTSWKPEKKDGNKK